MQWTALRIQNGPDATHGAQAFAELEPLLGGSITQDGLGADQAIRLFSDTIVPSTRPFGHPTSLSFVASAASPASLSFDAALGAANIFAGNWDGGGGAVHAENQALRWISDLAGWPETAGGVLWLEERWAIFQHFMPPANEKPNEYPDPGAGRSFVRPRLIVRSARSRVLWM